MPTLAPEVLQNTVAVSLACATATACRRALAEGFVKDEDLLSVRREQIESQPVWRFNFGRLTPDFRRGGDFIVEVGVDSGAIIRVMRGQ